MCQIEWSTNEVLMFTILLYIPPSTLVALFCKMLRQLQIAEHGKRGYIEQVLTVTMCPWLQRDFGESLRSD